MNVVSGRPAILRQTTLSEFVEHVKCSEKVPEPMYDFDDRSEKDCMWERF